MFKQMFFLISCALTLGSIYSVDDQALVKSIESLDVDGVRKALQDREEGLSEQEYLNYIDLTHNAKGNISYRRDRLSFISGLSCIGMKFFAPMAYFPFWLSSRKWFGLNDDTAGWLKGVARKEAPILYYLNKATFSMMLTGGAFTLITTLLYKYYANRSDRSFSICKLLRKNKKTSLENKYYHFVI